MTAADPTPTPRLDYAPGDARPVPRWLWSVAMLSALYPLFVLGTLYGGWCVAWFLLGRRPVPSLDDPALTLGSGWMPTIAILVLVSFIPVGGAAVFLNCALIARRHLLRGMLRRMTWVAGIWLAVLFVLLWDPWDVLMWWQD